MEDAGIAMDPEHVEATFGQPAPEPVIERPEEGRDPEWIADRRQELMLIAFEQRHIP